MKREKFLGVRNKMNNQALGAGLSFLIHAVLITIVLLMGSLVHIEQRPIVIDFSVSDSSGSNQQSAASSQQSQRAEERSEPVKQREVVQARPVESPAPIAEVKEQVQEESPVSIPVEEKPVKSAETMVGWTRPTGNWRAQPALLSEEGSGGDGSPGTGDAAGSGKKGDALENAKNLYLKEHFTYIRDLIMKNLSYPHTARRMGWEGKVTVSFVISEDGYASEIKIVESSGFGVLDRNAVETVKKASPFPKPPIRAELVMPVVYKLR